MSGWFYKLKCLMKRMFPPGKQEVIKDQVTQQQLGYTKKADYIPCNAMYKVHFMT